MAKSPMEIAHVTTPKQGVIARRKSRPKTAARGNVPTMSQVCPKYVPNMSHELGTSDGLSHVPGVDVPMSQGTPCKGGSIGTPTWDMLGHTTEPRGPLPDSLGTFVGHEAKNPVGHRRGKPQLTIIEDTREQTPLTGWPDGVAVEVRGLDTGDYSIVGWEHCFAIERKSLDDLAQTMMGGYEANTQKPRKRFNNELERLRHFDCAAVIVTATPAEVLAFKHHCGMDAHGALWGFALSVFATYGVPVFFLGDAPTAARWIADLARKYIAVRTKKNRDAERRAKCPKGWEF